MAGTMSNASKPASGASAITGQAFVAESDTGWEITGPGVRRKIVAHGPELMLVRVAFDEGGIGPEHAHPHVQCTLVETGRFAITIDGITRMLSAGDSFFVASNLPHSAIALSAGTLLDSFTPMRAEFLDQPAANALSESPQLQRP
jgi:quercetin dioxygenase-like cupin family protein